MSRTATPVRTPGDAHGLTESFRTEAGSVPGQRDARRAIRERVTEAPPFRAAASGNRRETSTVNRHEGIPVSA